MSRIGDLIAELCPDGVSFHELSEVTRYPKESVDATTLGPEDFIGVDNLLPNKKGRVDSTYGPNTASVTQYRVGDVLLGNIRPYLRKVWLADRDGGASGDVLVFRIRDDFKAALSSAFLYYILSSEDFFRYNIRNSRGAKMPRGDKSALMHYRVPVPPLELQREIVRILDLFTGLEVELESELEAELEARRKQYEFYRDQLLTFPEGGGKVDDLG